MTSPPARESTQASSADGGGEPASVPVLLVDDDSMFRYLLGLHFERVGEEVPAWDFQIREAGSAEEASDALGADPKIAMVLLDCRLHDGLDGLELLKRWRAEGETRPVVMTTAYDDQYIIDRIHDAGAEEYLSKSQIDPERLARLVARVLGSEGG